MQKELVDASPTFDEFNKAFMQKKYSNKTNIYSTLKKAVKHIIESVETYKLNSSELKIGKFTVEHILGDDGVELTAELGNLLPLAEGLNGNAGNEKLKKKLIYYKSSKFEMVKEFVEQHGLKENWEQKDIEKRALDLSKLCYEKIWK